MAEPVTAAGITDVKGGGLADPGVARAPEVKSRSLWDNAWDELRRNPLFWISSALILLFVVMAIAPQLFTNKDPNYADLSLARQPPSKEAWFGYDGQGYDVYART